MEHGGARVSRQPRPPDDDDATVKLPRKRAYGRPTDRVLFPAGGGMPPTIRLLALFLVMVVGVVGWFLMREPVQAPDAPPATQSAGMVAPAGLAPRIAVQVADEAQILAHQAEQRTAFRLAPNPRVVVLDFPSLLDQGLTLNRVAALVEKTGLPRDRVLTDAELNAAIAASGDTMDTYYYGHDYAAADLARFFDLAKRDGVQLRPQEIWLRTLLDQEGLLAPDIRGAVISIPRAGVEPIVDAALRATILRHELSHAEYFSNPTYAAYARHFWRTGLDEGARELFRTYLAGQGYDRASEDLMINEMQAYLAHTPDPRMFNAGALGITQAQLLVWQDAFLSGMPAGWLRSAALLVTRAPGTPLGGAASTRQPRLRRRRQRGSVSTRMARPLTRTPRRMADSSAA